MSEIFVLVEHDESAVRDVTFEMLALASGLGAGAVAALIVGSDVGPVVRQLESAADILLKIEHPALAEQALEPLLATVAHTATSRQPRLLLVGHTARGMEIGPAVAARLAAPLVTDCLDLGWSAGVVAARRHAYGGKVNERLTLLPAPLVVATIRPGGRPAVRDLGRVSTVEIVPPPALPGPWRRQTLDVVQAALADVDISDAEFLVSVGRGIGKADNLDVVREFADALGATLSCSRPVADKGWLPKSRQVGTSGRTVRPKVYLALGISGAYQHVAGMRGADLIIAVNTDPAAPIFEVAHAGIVADLFDVLPVLRDALAGTA